MRSLSDHFPDGLPECLTVRREMDLPGIDVNRCAFLRPGEIIFDALCHETIRAFQKDVQAGYSATLRQRNPIILLFTNAKLGSLPRFKIGI